MKVLIFIFSLLFTLHVSSQEVRLYKEHKVLPISIYAVSLNNFSLKKTVKVRGGFLSFKFRQLNVEAINNGDFFISSINIGKKSSKFIYETFQDIAMSKSMTSTFFDLEALYRMPYDCPKHN